MAWIDKLIEVGGDGKFLTINNHWIVKDGEKFHPGGGVYYEPGEVPEVSFDITNESKFTISAFIKALTYHRNIGGQVLQEQKGESIILAPAEKITKQLSLPLLIRPQTHVSVITLYDTETETRVSNTIAFRWIISGLEDAEILFVNLDKPLYQQGETAKIRVQLTGPADYRIEGDEGIIMVELFNQEGRVVGETRKAAKLQVDEITIDVPIKENVDNPKVVTRIERKNEVLDRYEFQALPFEEIEPPAKQERVDFFERYARLILAFVVFVALATIVFYYLKNIKDKKQNMKKSLLALFLWLFLLGAGLFSANTILAAVMIETWPSGGTTALFNRPLPNRTYRPGDVINFQGAFQITMCADGLFHNKITFFITTDEDIPLTKRNCCADCCGALTTYYLRHPTFDPDGDGCVQNAMACRDVAVLDLKTIPEDRIHKLGTVYPSDVLIGADPYWIEFDKSFIIPDDLEFSGPVRFYVQYSGTHWHAHWRWAIVYQRATIEQPPLAPANLQVIQTDYCLSGPAAILSWVFNDPIPGDSQSAYQVQIDDSPDFASLIRDPRKIISRSNSYGIPLGVLNYNTTYYWRVRVWDQKDIVSKWSIGPSFTTPRHSFPRPDFTWAPPSPTVNEVVVFTDQSIIHEGATITRWSWTFENGNPANSSQRNPTVSFGTTGPKQVTLRVTDSSGYTCSIQKTVNVQAVLPEWMEVPPR